MYQLKKTLGNSIRAGMETVKQKSAEISTKCDLF